MQRPILVVDDDPHIRETIVFALKKAGYATVEAADGAQGLSSFRDLSPHPQLVVLDIMMPEMDGTDLCREIRKTSDVPIIFLSSRDEELDRILGLELGGDDYLTKPFSPRELVARIKAIQRRISPDRQNVCGKDESLKELVRGEVRMNLDSFQTVVGEKEVVLTVIEFELFKTLLRTPQKVFSRAELMTKAYGEEVVVADRTIDSHVRRIREKFRKLGHDPIETVTGFGYRLHPDL